MSEKDVGHDDNQYAAGPVTTAHKILAAIEPLIFAKRKLTMGILVAITLVLFWQMNAN